MITINKIDDKPFKNVHFAIGEIPKAYSMALSYEEQILWFCNYIEKTLLPKVNECIEEVNSFDITIDGINNRINLINNRIDNIEETIIDITGNVNNNTLSIIRIDEEITGINAKLEEKAELVMIYSDGTAIYSNKEMTDVMTYNDVKEILNDDNKLVTLFNGNYILRPEYTYSKGQEDAIWFNGVTSLEGRPYIYRIIINSNNEVTSDEYSLALEWEISSVTELIYKNFPKSETSSNNSTLTFSNSNGSPAYKYSIKGDNLSSYIGIVSHSNNYFNNNWELGTINGTTGQNQVNNSVMRCKDFIPVEELTSYKFSSNDSSLTTLYVYEYKEDFTYNLTANKGINLNTYLTTNADTKYIRIRPANYTPNFELKIMMNIGVVALPYEKYVNATSYIDLKNNILTINDTLNVDYKGNVIIETPTTDIHLGIQENIKTIVGDNILSVTSLTGDVTYQYISYLTLSD